MFFDIGELSLLRNPSCSSRELVYIWSVNSGATDLKLADIRFSFGRDTSELGEVFNFTAMVMLVLHQCHFRSPIAVMNCSASL